VNVVSERLGHASAVITMTVYANCRAAGATTPICSGG
jgi:hypothetical protein